jgi:hypothetical protein
LHSTSVCYRCTDRSHNTSIRTNSSHTPRSTADNHSACSLLHCRENFCGYISGFNHKPLKLLSELCTNPSRGHRIVYYISPPPSSIAACRVVLGLQLVRTGLFAFVTMAYLCSSCEDKVCPIISEAASSSIHSRRQGNIVHSESNIILPAPSQILINPKRLVEFAARECPIASMVVREWESRKCPIVSALVRELKSLSEVNLDVRMILLH